MAVQSYLVWGSCAVINPLDPHTSGDQHHMLVLCKVLGPAAAEERRVVVRVIGGEAFLSLVGAGVEGSKQHTEFCHVKVVGYTKKKPERLRGVLDKIKDAQQAMAPHSITRTPPHSSTKMPHSGANCSVADQQLTGARNKLSQVQRQLDNLQAEHDQRLTKALHQYNRALTKARSNYDQAVRDSATKLKSDQAALERAKQVAQDSVDALGAVAARWRARDMQAAFEAAQDMEVEGSAASTGTTRRSTRRQQQLSMQAQHQHSTPSKMPAGPAGHVAAADTDDEMETDEQSEAEVDSDDEEQSGDEEMSDQEEPNSKKVNSRKRPRNSTPSVQEPQVRTAPQSTSSGLHQQHSNNGTAQSQERRQLQQQMEALKAELKAEMQQENDMLKQRVAAAEERAAAAEQATAALAAAARPSVDDMLPPVREITVASRLSEEGKTFIPHPSEWAYILEAMEKRYKKENRGAFNRATSPIKITKKVHTRIQRQAGTAAPPPPQTSAAELGSARYVEQRLPCHVQCCFTMLSLKGESIAAVCIWYTCCMGAAHCLQWCNVVVAAVHCKACWVWQCYNSSC